MLVYNCYLQCIKTTSATSNLGKISPSLSGAMSFFELPNNLIVSFDSNSSP